MAKHGIQGMVGGGSAEGGAMHKVVLDWQTAHANNVFGATDHRFSYSR
jgi:hypothetical protein